MNNTWLRCAAWQSRKILEGILTNVNKAHLAEEAGRRIIMARFIDTMLDED